MYGTKISHVLRWMWRLLISVWRDRKSLPELGWLFRPGCRGLLAIGLIAGFALVSFVLFNGPAFQAWFASLGLAVVLVALLKVVQFFVHTALLNFIGDAARYLDVHPTNVARRYDILRGGVAMLHKLHEMRDEGINDKGDKVARGRYGRLVLVGHSLGSVIAYDIAKHYWYKVNKDLPIEDSTDALLKAVSEFTPRKKSPLEAVKTYRCNQIKAWASLNRKHCHNTVQPAETPLPKRWLVTDLVTLGSPLAYSRFLLADGTADFERKIRLRELPTCPPDRSRTVNPDRYTIPLSAEAVPVGKNYQILHHAAHFAITRWTNICLPNDPVGYKLEQLGGGILEVDFKKKSSSPSILSAHTSYWRFDARNAPWGRKIHKQILAILKHNVFVAEEHCEHKVQHPQNRCTHCEHVLHESLESGT